MLSIVVSKRMKDPNFHPLWRLAKTLTKVPNGTLTLRDVKNGTTSGDVYENKGGGDKMSCEKPPLYTKIHELAED